MELSDLRKRINELNDALLPLFLERMDISADIAAYKMEHGMPILDKNREREILAKMIDKGGENNEAYVYSFYSRLMDLSKARQIELTTVDTTIGNTARYMIENEKIVFPKTGLIACQGVEGANSQEACDHLFPRGHILYVKSFEAVFKAVDSGLCKFGVLPIENSSNGSVRAVYSLMQKYHCYIVRSTRQLIHHTLLAKPGTKMSDIRTIYSHEQALGQCSKFLEGLEGVNSVPFDNTALAAKMVAESDRRDIAAIASRRCEDLYGLEVLNDRIQNHDNNYTRFICITKDPVMYEGANHISLIVSLAHKPGSLNEMLEKPAALGINLLKLESCPIPGRDFEFVFFLELEASVKERGVLPMLEELERTCQDVWFLGAYAEA